MYIPKTAFDHIPAPEIENLCLRQSKSKLINQWNHSHPHPSCGWVWPSSAPACLMKISISVYNYCRAWQKYRNVVNNYFHALDGGGRGWKISQVQNSPGQGRFRWCFTLKVTIVPTDATLLEFFFVNFDTKLNCDVNSPPITEKQNKKSTFRVLWGLNVTVLLQFCVQLHLVWLDLFKIVNS